VNAQPDPRVPAYRGRILDSRGNPAGTCFQLRPGLLVTAYHVLESLGAVTEGDVVNVDALAGGGEPFPATVAATAPLHDLAVLKPTAGALGASVPGAAPTDAMVPGEPVLVTGAAHVEDTYTYRFLDDLGSWQGATTRDDAIPLGRLEANAVMKGMSGAPVRRKADDVVVGIVSGRYNSADDWLRNSSQGRNDRCSLADPGVRSQARIGTAGYEGGSAGSGQLPSAVSGELSLEVSGQAGGPRGGASASR
jgi:Trypsin-like peptidase domain